METIVASGSPLASSAPIQERGSGNKRKLSADPPISDPTFISDQMLSDLNHHLLTLGSYGHGDNNICDSCTAAPWCSLKEQLHEAKWNDIAESELEATLLKNLNMIFKSAIIKIMSHGYHEETAIVSILRTRLCFGVKDTVSSIVDSALLFLKSGSEFDYVTRDKLLEELNEREISALNEMIGVVKEFTPSISRGEAMWSLLVSDMIVFYACSIGSAFSSAPGVGPEPESCNSDIQTKPVSDSLGYHKPDIGLPNPENPIEKDSPNVFRVTSLPNGSFSASIKESLPNGSLVEETSSLFISQPNSSSGKRVYSGKRESILRHKTVHFEKCSRGFRTKATIRTSKYSSVNGLLIDRKTKTFSGSNNALSMKDTLMKLNKGVGSDVPPPKADISLNLSLNNMHMKLTDIANIKLSLSRPSTSSNEFCAPLDEMLQKLCNREKAMEAEMEEWIKWAQQKVMEAAHRLGKDKLELQTLRLEREEVSRLKKENQSLQNNIRKEFEALGYALSTACAQTEKKSTEARNKERENVELRKALVALKLQAAESAANYREISKKDLKNDKNVKFREREKALLREELVTKKKMTSHLKQQLEQAKARYDQLETRWKKQERVKQELLDQYNVLRKEQDQIEVSGRSKENEMRLKAETDLQRHKNEIRKLRMQILQMRQKTDPSKIVVFNNWGGDPKSAGKNVVNKPFELEDEDVDREKECVMCLSEEMSVLFLPCRHLVVCEACNEALEKQGNKDCPSCRTNIEKRVIVRSS